jgi:hypothetical protein
MFACYNLKGFYEWDPREGSPKIFLDTTDSSLGKMFRADVGGRDILFAFIVYSSVESLDEHVYRD